ncbi:hypothetical protein M0D69_04155 [Caballeronia sp. SEWSISQ10-4 2]|uniref:hypothetical protein n=1 Tax=Caballeronia sp. SEWSISQ10-4 2 TaxID=2937438 RepID=UPI00264C4569|nr:hypothetical protein [Caballeronia sp. SEWSISQ10-4 2]MDN7177215.1 hypothetical protein [Caballeronia sp. SEWSISQ10-4 2]
MSTAQMNETATGSTSYVDRKSKRQRARLSADLENCEKMLADAADANVVLDSADVATIRNARGVLDQGAWDYEWERAFLAAMGRVARTIYYPSAQVFKDMRSADELLSHATLAGLQLLPEDIAALTQARLARAEARWSAEIETAFYAALNRISKGVLPVVAATAGSNAHHGSRRAIKIYTITAISLTIFVVALSCLLFTVNRISDDVLKIVGTNDASAMILHNQLMSHESSIIETREKQELELRKLLGSAYQQRNRSQDEEESVIAARQHASSDLRALSNSQPALQIKDLLQQFATNNRQLYNDVTRTQGIGDWLFLPVTNPYTEPDCGHVAARAATTAGNTKSDSSQLALDWTCSKSKIRANLEIKVPIMEADHVTNESNETLRAEDAVQEGFQKIAAYQDIRAMAMYGREIVLSLVGAVTGFVLPVLYAWLGACAAILRKIRIESETSTFHPEYSTVANRSHITCAVIVGIAIGLFSDLVQGGKNISPLAVAFIAGYASDKFFYFVDRLVEVIFPSRTQAKASPAKAVIEPGRGAMESKTSYAS